MANDPQLKRYRRLSVILCKAIGAVAFPVGTIISLMAVLLVEAEDPRMASWQIAAVGAVGLAFLIGSVLSLSRKRSGAFGAAFVSGLLLLYLGYAWFDAENAQSAYLSTEQFRIAVAIVALPEILILLLAAWLVSTTVSIGRRRAELDEVSDTEGLHPPLA